MIDYSVLSTLIFAPSLDWTPCSNEQGLSRIKRRKKTTVSLLHADLSSDLTTSAKGSKARKRYLKRKYLGKSDRNDLISGEIGNVQGMSFVSSAYQPQSLKFPTPTQVFHKRKKQKRALTGRR